MGTVAAVLMVARRCLQLAIKDARALYRKSKEDYRRARFGMNLRVKQWSNKDLHSVADMELDQTMCYRALNGYDRLAYDVKCGFDMAQLETLVGLSRRCTKKQKRRM